jgi:glycosyltransferase involved in cell wall biosynthesis
MKILVVCQYYYPEQFRINDICEQLVSDGHHVTVLTGLPNYPSGKVPNEYRWLKKRKETINGVHVIRCFEIGRKTGKLRLALNYLSYTISASLRVIFLRKDFDIVLVNQLSPVTMAIPAILYKKLHGKKLFLYCLDLWPDSLAAAGIKKESIIFRIIYRMSRRIYAGADSIAVTSKSFSLYFDKVLKISGQKIEYLPQYAEEIFDNVKDDKQEHTIKNMVFAGNIGEMQSVETIILAANELKNRSDIHFHVVGGGSSLETCQQLAQEYQLTNISFYGQRPLSEMPDLYKLADAMLITLKKNEFISYTLPGKLQSYMAAGKPVLGAIDGETRRVIEESQCGLCCEAEDYKSLAQIIERFTNDQVNQLRYAKNSFDYYQRYFNESEFYEKLYSIITPLMEANNV